MSSGRGSSSGAPGVFPDLLHLGREAEGGEGAELESVGLFVGLWMMQVALGALDLLERELDAVEIVAGAVKREGAGGERQLDATVGAADLVAGGERAEADGAARVERPAAAMVAGSLTGMVAAVTGAASGDGAAGLTIGLDGGAEAYWHISLPFLPAPRGGVYLCAFDSDNYSKMAVLDTLRVVYGQVFENKAAIKSESPGRAMAVPRLFYFVPTSIICGRIKLLCQVYPLADEWVARFGGLTKVSQWATLKSNWPSAAKAEFQ